MGSGDRAPVRTPERAAADPAVRPLAVRHVEAAEVMRVDAEVVEHGGVQVGLVVAPAVTDGALATTAPTTKTRVAHPAAAAAGKTTMTKALAGETQPTGGKI
ncbi:hypothetical protein IAE22_28805, partial [Bacillus sp. S34]|nr:hypothetical protein [Bacillus sp. S34]